MTSLLRLVLSAVSGAVLVTGLFVVMGKATAPRPVFSNTPETGHAELGTPSWSNPERTVERNLPAVPALADWTSTPVHPGFEVDTRIDRSHLEPDLVVLSQPVATTEAVNERRWWQALARNLSEK